MKSRVYYFICLFFSGLFYSTATFAECVDLTLDNIYQDILAHYPQYKDITYGFPSSNNKLKIDDWLLQTPNIWNSSLVKYNEGFIPKNGHTLDSDFLLPTCDTNQDCDGVSECKLIDFSNTPKKLCLTKAHDFLSQIYNTIISANDFVDIATLGNVTPISTKAFTTTLMHALQKLGEKSANQNRQIVVRILQGSFLPFGYIQIKNYLNQILSYLPNNHHLVISLADMRSCILKKNCGNMNDSSDLFLSFAFSHAKILNVDNKVLITGGENFFADDYLYTNPVNDSGIKIYGDVVQGSKVYTDIVWNYLSKNKGIFSNFCRTYYSGNLSNTCLTDVFQYIEKSDHAAQEMASTDGFLPVKAMYVSKLNNGIGIGDDADQSEFARVSAFTHAQHTIKIAQQALYAPSLVHFDGKDLIEPFQTIDGNVIDAIAYAIHMKQVHTYIITGNLSDDNSITGYSAFTNLGFIEDCLIHTLEKKFRITHALAKRQVRKYLHMGYLGYFPYLYVNDPKIMAQHRSHNKFWMVDDRIFYFGSHNIYATSIQEFGIIVEADFNISQNLLLNFWEPMWFDAVKFVPRT